MYEIFEKLCEQRNVTPYKVSKATGISRTTLSDWKSGKYQLKHEKLQKIADYFGVSVEYLTTGKQPSGYYLNDETAKIAQQIFENPNLRALFDVSADATPDDLKMVADFMMRLKRTNKDG